MPQMSKQMGTDSTAARRLPWERDRLGAPSTLQLLPTEVKYIWIDRKGNAARPMAEGKEDSSAIPAGTSRVQAWRGGVREAGQGTAPLIPQKVGSSVAA